MTTTVDAGVHAAAERREQPTSAEAMKRAPGGVESAEHATGGACGGKKESTKKMMK